MLRPAPDMRKSSVNRGFSYSCYILSSLICPVLSSSHSLHTSHTFPIPVNGMLSFHLLSQKNPQTPGVMLSPFLLSHSTCSQMAVGFDSTFEIDSELTTSPHCLLLPRPSSHHLPLAHGRDVRTPLPTAISPRLRPDRLFDQLPGELC